MRQYPELIVLTQFPLTQLSVVQEIPSEQRTGDQAVWLAEVLHSSHFKSENVQWYMDTEVFGLIVLEE